MNIKSKSEFVGQRLNKLTIVDYKPSQPKGRNCQCKCDCGNVVWVRYSNLKYGLNKSCGCLNKTRSVNLVGKKFNHLTILSLNQNSKLEKRWKVKCDCGMTFYRSSVCAIKNGLQQTCSFKKCQYHKSLVEKFKGSVIETFKIDLNKNLHSESQQIVLSPILFDRKIKTIIQSAKKRKMNVNVDEKYIGEIFNQQKGLCALSHIKLNNKTASLDRIDSTKGYVIGNVQWVHSIVNVLKLYFDQNYFIDMCVAVSNYSKNKAVKNSFCKYSPSQQRAPSYKGELKRSFWNTRIVKKSRIRGIYLDPHFKLEDAEEIFFRQEGLCALSGIPIQLRPFKQLTASLDRINSSLGYTKNNVQWVHKHINLMKSKLDDATFILLCNVISKKNYGVKKFDQRGPVIQHFEKSIPPSHSNVQVK